MTCQKGNSRWMVAVEASNDPAAPASVDEFRSAYQREVAKWAQFTREAKVKL